MSPKPRPFEHIVAGIAYPSMEMDRPGAIVVLRTVWDPHDKASKPWFYELHHDSSDSLRHLATLFRTAAEVHDQYSVDEWWGDALNEAYTALLYGQELGCAPIPMAPAPYIEHKDRTALYLQSLREMLQPGKVALKFAKGSRLPDAVKQYPVSEKKPIEQYPPLAALCYAASACYLWLQVAYVEPEKIWGQLIKERAERLVGEDAGLPWESTENLEVENYLI